MSFGVLYLRWQNCITQDCLALEIDDTGECRSHRKCHVGCTAEFSKMGDGSLDSILRHSWWLKCVVSVTRKHKVNQTRHSFGLSKVHILTFDTLYNAISLLSKEKWQFCSTMFTKHYSGFTKFFTALNSIIWWLLSSLQLY